MKHILCLIAGLMLAGNVSAAERFLGRVDMDNWDRSETLNVGACGLTDLRMQITGDDIFIEDVVVQFGNGDIQFMPVRHRYNKGTTTPWMDLQAGVRCVTKIYVRGSSSWNFRPTKLDFFGYRRGVTAPAKKGKLLGQTWIGNFPDRDTVAVKRCGLNYVRVALGGDGAYIQGIRVVYGNPVAGVTGTQTFRIDNWLWLGESTRWFDLKGNSSRCLWNVSVIGQSEPGGGQTLAKVYGL